MEMLQMLMHIHPVTSPHQPIFQLMTNILNGMKLAITRILAEVMFSLFSKLSKVTQDQDIFRKNISILFSFSPSVTWFSKYYP